MVSEATPKKRILCIGKITKGRMTMVIVFHRRGGSKHVTLTEVGEVGDENVFGKVPL